MASHFIMKDMKSLIAIMSMTLLACIGSADNLPVVPFEIPVVEPSPVPRPPVVAKPVPTQDAGIEDSYVCDTSVVTYVAGKRCGLEATGRATCPAKEPIDGYVYICRGDELLRPPIEGCRVWTNYLDGNSVHITRVLCMTAEWVPFEDGRCPSGKRGYAGPSKEPGLVVPSPPSDCTPMGFWGIENAYGPVCCR